MMKITIDIELNNWILNIPENEIENVANKYLKLGYLTSTLCETNLNYNNNIFDPIKNKLENLSESNNNKLEVIGSKINENLDVVKRSIDNLSANNNKSVLKGQYGENLVESIIDINFPDYSLINTTKKDCASDYQLVTNLGDIMLIEVKNYSNVVPSNEVNKFIRDLSQSSSKIGIFISLHSGISNKKRFCIDYYDDKKIIFIPKSGTEGSSIIWGILLGLELINSNSKYNNITETNLMEIYNDFEKVLNSHFSLMNNIKDSKEKIEKTLNNLYISTIDYDINIKNAFKDVKNKIRSELNNISVKLIENNYEYYEKIIHDLNEQKDNKYIIYYDILELVKSNNKKIRAEEENKLNWEIYDCDKIICNIKSNKRKVEILYEDNIITINNSNIIKMIIK